MHLYILAVWKKQNLLKGKGQFTVGILREAFDLFHSQLVFSGSGATLGILCELGGC